MEKIKVERLIIQWVIILYLISLPIYSIIGECIIDFVIGLTLSTVLCLAKFLLNSYYFNTIISRKKSNAFILIMTNLLFLVIFFISIYIIYKILGQISLIFICGITLGLSYIPSIIIIGNILQSLYIIRNKFK